MIDAHLINLALAGIGISAAAAILLAAAIIAISAIVPHRGGGRGRQRKLSLTHTAGTGHRGGTAHPRQRERQAA